jgi:hypothetical protein
VALHDDGRVALARRCKVLHWPATRWGPRTKLAPYTHVCRFKHW